MLELSRERLKKGVERRLLGFYEQVEVCNCLAMKVLEMINTFSSLINTENLFALKEIATSAHRTTIVSELDIIKLS